MLKNYTSQIPASRSICFIENKLVTHGAKKIQKLYDDKQRLSSICFAIAIEGQEVYFKLPARVQNCEKILEANLSRRARPETRKKIPAQAERTAWKILADWTDAQFAMIDLAQIETLEVFMPYVFDGKQTYYEALKETGYKALLPGKVER